MHKSFEKNNTYNKGILFEHFKTKNKSQETKNTKIKNIIHHSFSKYKKKIQFSPKNVHSGISTKVS